MTASPMPMSLENTPHPKPRSVLWKILMMTVLTLLLLIPLGMIEGVMSERRALNDSVGQDIASTWAAEQTLIGPVLAIPYQTVVVEEDSKGKKQHHVIEQTLYLLPETYQVKTRLKPEIRYRGIYKHVVYVSHFDAQGAFSLDSLKPLQLNPKGLIWKKAAVIMGLHDTKGIQGQPRLVWNGKPVELLPGTMDSVLSKAGLHADVALQPQNGIIPYQFQLVLRGSKAFSIQPIGKQTHIAMSAPWAAPGFTGAPLPTTRQINEHGFTATWDVPYFTRNMTQAFLASEKTGELFRNTAVGSTLLIPADIYQQSERAVKYGILFLLMTFSTFFLFEVLAKCRVHPMQYLFIGCALCLFFLLLISLSEAIGFLWAYIGGSVAVIVMISLYTLAIARLQQRPLHWMIAGVLTGLYAYLYILLQLEDWSLLFGALGLFVFLGSMMYFTRNINWYQSQSTSS